MSIPARLNIDSNPALSAALAAWAATAGTLAGFAGSGAPTSA